MQNCLEGSQSFMCKAWAKRDSLLGPIRETDKEFTGSIFTQPHCGSYTRCKQKQRALLETFVSQTSDCVKQRLTSNHRVPIIALSSKSPLYSHYSQTSPTQRGWRTVQINKVFGTGPFGILPINGSGKGVCRFHYFSFYLLLVKLCRGHHSFVPRIFRNSNFSSRGIIEKLHQTPCLPQ